MIIQRDSVVHDIQVLERGALEVRSGGEIIARNEPGQFIGEMSFLSGERATADVVATEASQVLAWSQESLNKLLDKKPVLAYKMRGILGRDVVVKLRAHGKPVG
jgi:CRP-like cAMP-binding protein